MSRHGDTRDSDAEDLNESSSERPENELLSFPEEAIGSNVDEDNDEFSSQRAENERPPEPEENVDSDSNGDYDLYSDFVTDIPPPPDRAAYVHQRTRPARPGPSSIRIAPPLSRAQLDQAHYERIAKARRFYSPILTANEYKFWFNKAHSQFLRRLRTQERFSIRRSIYLAALALYVSYDDFRVWHRLYGPVGAGLVATFAKKSIWKLQAEVLASVIDEIQWKYHMPDLPIPPNPLQDKEKQPTFSENPRPQSINRSPSAASHASESPIPVGPQPDKRNSLENRPSSPMDQGNNYVQRRNIKEGAPLPPPEFSGPGLSFKKAVEDESTRIGTSGGIITAVAMAALALPNLSQTHWVARSCWTSSMVTALLAVYFSNDQAWTISHLSSEKKLRAWIMDVDPEDDYEDVLRLRLKNSDGPSTVIMNSIAPAPSSAIAISAPSLLLSSSLLLLLSGMGVFLAFIWTWEVDKDAGTPSSRDVFIVYIITLGVSLATVGFFSFSRVAVPIRQTIIKSIIGLQIDARREGFTNRVNRKEVILIRQLLSATDTRELMKRQGARFEERMEQLQQAVLSK